jgi:hypothetical protein
MSVIQVGLVDKTGALDPALVQAAAASLNVQVMRDLPQWWPISATIQYLPNPKKIPVGVWLCSWSQNCRPARAACISIRRTSRIRW